MNVAGSSYNTPIFTSKWAYREIPSLPGLYSGSAFIGSSPLSESRFPGLRLLVSLPLLTIGQWANGCHAPLTVAGPFRILT